MGIMYGTIHLVNVILCFAAIFCSLLRHNQGVNNWEEYALQKMHKWWHHKVAAAASCDITGVKCFINRPDTVVSLPSISSISILKLLDSIPDLLTNKVQQSLIHILNVFNIRLRWSLQLGSWTATTVQKITLKLKKTKLIQ